MPSGNPSLRESTFKKLPIVDAANAMTMQGTVTKSFILVGLAILGGSFVWAGSLTVSSAFAMVGLVCGGILGLILALVTIFKKEWSPYTAPPYAFCQGLSLGAMSMFMEAQLPGIVTQALCLTFGLLIIMLMMYQAGWLRATDNFRRGIVLATMGVALLYLVDMALMFFGMPIRFIHEGGTYGILFSLVVVTIATLNLILDFDFIEQAAKSQVPKYMEWYGAFGLMVTLVWLYMEILRMLAKFSRRR